MSDTTKIQWADATFNPWIGCTKVSAGCKNCYAENTTRARVLRSQGHETWGKGAKRSRTSAALWRKPFQWNKNPWICPHGEESMQGAPSGHGPYSADVIKRPGPCCECGELLHRMRVFPSLCDWLDDEVPIEWLADFLKLIHDTPNLDWLLLTKRPENFQERMNLVYQRFALRTPTDVQFPDTGTPCDLDSHVSFCTWMSRWLGINAKVRAFYNNGEAAVIPPKNVWFGVSAENQEVADKRIPELLQIPAKVRFLSVEPMLGPVDLQYSCFNGADSIQSLAGLHWIIFGGESGKGARPCNVEWIRDGVKQCNAAGVKAFVKQVGSCPVVSDSMEWRMGKEGDECRTFGSPLVGDIKCHILTPAEPQVFPRRKMILKDPKGGDMSEWPDDLKVREMPSPPGII